MAGGRGTDPHDTVSLARQRRQGVKTQADVDAEIERIQRLSATGDIPDTFPTPVTFAGGTTVEGDILIRSENRTALRIERFDGEGVFQVSAPEVASTEIGLPEARSVNLVNGAGLYFWSDEFITATGLILGTGYAQFTSLVIGEYVITVVGGTLAFQYNSGGATSFTIDGTTGNIATVGTVTLNKTSTTALLVRKDDGTTIVFNVNTSGDIISIQNNADLRGYSDGGITEKWAIDTSAGTAQFDGNIDSGSTITGSDLVATDDLTVQDDTFLGNDDTDIATIQGHDQHKSAAPGIAVGVALGTGGSVGATISGTDHEGSITFTAGTTSLTTGVCATISFTAARGGTAYSLELTPIGATAGVNAIQFYGNRDSASAWSIRANVAPASGSARTYSYSIREWSN